MKGTGSNRLNRLSSSLVAVVVGALTILAVGPTPAAGETADVDADPDEPPMTAAGLLRDVRGRFPRDPLDICGEMIVRRRRGVEVSRVGFFMTVDWGAVPARFDYRVLDDEGDVRRALTLRLRPGARPALTGTDGRPVSLDHTIESTDLTWGDLSLSFLWWAGGRIVGTDRTKGRDCYLVDVPAPAWRAAMGAYRRVRLWIDQSLHMLLRAEGYDAEDRRVRSLWVRSLKRTDERWMIKDLEVQGYPAIHRTRVRIHSVTAHKPRVSATDTNVMFRPEREGAVQAL